MEIVHQLLWFLKPEGIQWLIQTGGLPVSIPASESEESQWEVRVGLARDGERYLLATPDSDDGMVTVGVWVILIKTEKLIW